MKLHLNFLARPAAAWAVGLAAALLAACGGGDEVLLPPPVAAPATVPDSATASTRAYTLFAGSLAPSEAAQPLLLGEREAPTSETEEPLPVD